MVAEIKGPRGKRIGAQNRVAMGVKIPGAATSAAAVNGRAGVAPVPGDWLYVAKGAHGVRVRGAATSAAKMNCRAGFVPVSGLWLYVPGEGFVRWSELAAQVEEAYLQWRRKKAMEGVLIFDGAERRQAEITRGGAVGDLRQVWLHEWGERHRGLCQVAGVMEVGMAAA